MYFKQEYQTCGIHLTLEAPEHQEMNGELEVALRTLHTIAQSFMVQVRVSEAYTHFAFMYTTDHIFTVLPIKYLINKDGNLTTPFKIATGTKPSVSHLHVLFFHVLYRKVLHMFTKKR